MTRATTWYENIPMYFICQYKDGQLYLLRKKYVWDKRQNTLNGVYYVEPEAGGDSTETLVVVPFSEANAVIIDVGKQKNKDFCLVDIAPMGAVKEKGILF